ncbi:hypothetical protein [Cupriavidus necator]
MQFQNRNLHVVYDGVCWAIAVEGEGRLESGLDFTTAIAVATSFAVERRVFLYVHDKRGGIAERIDFGDAMVANEGHGLSAMPDQGTPDAEASSGQVHIPAEKDNAQ